MHDAPLDPWWRFRKTPKNVVHRAFAGICLVFAISFAAFWISDISRWEYGLLACGWTVAAVVHLWRSQIRFSLRMLLIVLTIAAAALGAISILVNGSMVQK